jgi:hypothetical protein
MARRFSARPARYPRPDNSGGLIDQAVCVADLFLPEGKAVPEVRQVVDGAESERIRTCGAARVKAPMLTRVNANPASAAEMQAGALQDQARSVVVGEQTFGKGNGANGAALGWLAHHQRILHRCPLPPPLGRGRAARRD